MALTKGLGTIYDSDAAYINLPLHATMDGPHIIKIKPPTATRYKHRIFTAVAGEPFKVPNFNGKKTLGYGENIFYVLLPDGKRLEIAGNDRWTVRFKEAARSDTDNSTIIVNHPIWVHQEFAEGAVNNQNKVFTIENIPITGTEYVYLDFFLMVRGEDYNIEPSQRRITFVEPPETGERIRVSYQILG